LEWRVIQLANGVGGYNPFPTFGGGDGGGGITQVKLAPSPVRFPTASSPRTTTVADAREDVSPLAYLAPVGLSFLANKFFNTQAEPQTNLDAEALSKLSDFELANYQTEQLYGPKTTQTTGQRIGQLATQYLPALFTNNDKELAAYISTATNFDNAQTTNKTNKQIKRRTYTQNLLKEMTPKNMTFVDLVEYEKSGDLTKAVRKGFLEGKPDLDRFGYTVNIDDGYYSTESDSAQNYAGNGSANWVPLEFLDKVTKIPRGSSADENNLNDWLKAQELRENSLLDVYGTIGTLIPILKDQATGDNLGGIGAGGQVTLALNNGFNNASSSLRAVASLAGFDSPFSTDEEGGLFEKGTGENAQAIEGLLLRQISGEDVDDELNKALGIFQKKTGFTFKRESGALATVEYNASMLKLAYTAAAAAGQSGRTLSDKDLAFFLEMVGYGKATGPINQMKYLVNFVGRITQEVENNVDVTFGVGGRKLQSVYANSLSSPKIQGITRNYFETALNGEPVLFDQNVSISDYPKLKFTKVPFLTRFTGKDTEGNYVNASMRKFFEALDNSDLDPNSINQVIGIGGSANLNGLFNQQ